MEPSASWCSAEILENMQCLTRCRHLDDEDTI
jgi:hypothetical protein